MFRNITILGSAIVLGACSLSPHGASRYAGTAQDGTWSAHGCISQAQACIAPTQFAPGGYIEQYVGVRTMGTVEQYAVETTCCAAPPLPPAPRPAPEPPVFAPPRLEPPVTEPPIAEPPVYDPPAYIPPTPEPPVYAPPAYVPPSPAPLPPLSYPEPDRPLPPPLRK